MLKVSFVVHSTIHLQKMPLVELSIFCIRYFSKMKCKPAKKITGQCFSTEEKATCTHSANLERETEITKIVTYPPFPLASSDNIQGQISEHIFAPNGGYRLYYPSYLFRNECSFENWGIFNNYPAKSRGISSDT